MLNFSGSYKNRARLRLVLLQNDDEIVMIYGDLLTSVVAML